VGTDVEGAVVGVLAVGGLLVGVDAVGVGGGVLAERASSYPVAVAPNPLRMMSVTPDGAAFPADAPAAAWVT
jgi:hypothetical protein